MPFNWAALVVMIAAVGTSGYYRRQARVGSETIARRREGGPVVAGRLVMSLLLFGPVLAYAVAPSWMTWASFALPEWARWLGLVVGLLAIPMVSWVLGSLGSNVSETVLTKEHHQLVSAGPYRWIRHPLYTTGIGLFLALGLMLASWFVLSVAVLVLLGIRLVVIPAEERRLVAKFADRYREYMRRTGAMWPRVRGPLLLAAAVVPAGLTGCTTAPTPATVAHPLDALTPDEIRTAASVARTDPRVAPALFASIALNDPPKADVLAWQPGRSIARQARVVAMASTTVFEVVVDLGARRLVSVVERHGVEPSVMTSEFEVPRIVLSNAEFVSALEKRGITDTAKLFCTPMTAGYFGIAPHEGRRPVKVTCFDTRRSTTNVRGWPIERLYAIVDLRTREVLSVTDGGVVPIADVDQNFTEAAVGDLRAARKPTVLAQPQGGTSRRPDRT